MLNKKSFHLFFIILFLLSSIFSCRKETTETYYEFGREHDEKRVKRWQAEQLKNVKDISVFHNFKFSDGLKNSQITFKHQVVEDLQKNYIANHYDHGNGISAADVNNDSLIDLLFINQTGPNELWINTGEGKFKRSPHDTPIQLKESVAVSAAFGDYNNDGAVDLVISTVRDGIFLYVNDGTGKFTDSSDLLKPNYNRHSSGVFFLDYNLDGKLDLFITNTGVYTEDKKRKSDVCYVGIDNSFNGHLFGDRMEPSVLYENKGSKGFVDVSLKKKLFEPNWNGDGTFISLGDDIRPQIYLTNMQGNDSLWSLNKKGNFENTLEETIGHSAWGTMGVKFFDYNNDGKFDLYTTDMHTDMFPPEPSTLAQQKIKMNNAYNVDKELRDIIFDKKKAYFGNLFFANNENNKFLEISDKINLENYWPWGISAEDVNADGYVDLFVTAGMNYTTDYGINWFYLNDKANSFVSAEFIVGIEPRKELLTPWFKLDCKEVDKNHKICKNYNEEVQVLAPKGSRSSGFFDLDNDGDLDIVTNEFNTGPQILINNLTDVKKVSFLKILLKGIKSNRLGLGARVEVVSSELQQTRYNNGKSGYLSQSSAPLYFGLDNKTKVDSIKVTWPSGQIDIIKKNISINKLLTIEEGKGVL